MEDREHIIARLREAGLRATQPRVVVYETLREVGGHRSVDDIAAFVSDRGHSISRMTIYNVVNDLRSVHLIMCADAGPGRALYEASDHWHHHFVCRKCASVFDVECVEGSKPCLEPDTDVPGTIDEAQIIFRGICNQCQRKSKDAH